MSEKKKMVKLDLSNFFISTENDDANEPKIAEEPLNTSKHGTLLVRKEKKGRGGKVVTIIESLKGSEAQLEELCKKLKQRCGTGGTVKDGAILMQGDIAKKIIVALEELGFKAKNTTM